MYMNKKTLLIIVIAVVVLISGYFVYAMLVKPTGVATVPVTNTPAANVPVAKAVDPKNASYVIDGASVALVNGVSEVPVPDSASVIKTAYFGNEVKADMNGDGVDDSAFILTQQTGGSGTFYYVAAALSSKDGYAGTNAILLGDRIAPQTTEFANGQIVVNYADRRPGDAMTVAPAVGTSKYVEVVGQELREAVANTGTNPPAATFNLNKTFIDSKQGITYAYPETLPTKYFHLQDWLQTAKLELSVKSFSCMEGNGVTGKTASVTINGKGYCVTTSSEGAAGTIYTTYTYAVPVFGTKVAALTFVIGHVTSCTVYGGTADEAACDQETFDPNALADQIISSIKLNK
jgi:hypothetical protein